MFAERKPLENATCKQDDSVVGVAGSYPSCLRVGVEVAGSKFPHSRQYPGLQ